MSNPFDFSEPPPEPPRRRVDRDDDERPRRRSRDDDDVRDRDYDERPRRRPRDDDDYDDDRGRRRQTRAEREDEEWLRRRRLRQEREDEEWARQRRVPRREIKALPGGIYFAGVIWVIFGILELILGFLVAGVLVMAIVGSQRVANQAAVQDVMMQLGVTAFILLTVGFLFMFFGLNVLRSRASDVIGPGIASLVLAGLFAISFIVLIERMHMLDGRGAAVQSARSTIIVAMVVTFLIGLILGVCGLLALVERGNYLEWMKRSRRRDKAPSNTMSGDDFASSFG